MLLKIVVGDTLRRPMKHCENGQLLLALGDIF
jgi:hypothetical protein